MMIIDDFSKGSPYRFLSNFYPDNGNTNEHYYQAFKTNDRDAVVQVLSAKSPGEAKRLGRKVSMRPTWDEEKDQVMLLLLRDKFEFGLKERHWLQDTRDAILIEGNRHGDTYWGATRTANRLSIKWPGNHGVVWYGKNMLGILLMQVRQEIKEGKL